MPTSATYHTRFIIHVVEVAVSIAFSTSPTGSGSKKKRAKQVSDSRFMAESVPQKIFTANATEIYILDII